MYKSLESKIRDMLEGKTGAISVTKDRDTMEHDPNDQVTVGTYKSKHFEISPEAQKLFSQGIPKNSNAIDAEHLAIHHDKLFALVKGAMVKKQVSDTDLENAKDHMSKIQYLATKLGLEGEINYLQPHVEKLFKHAGTEGNPFTSKPTEYTQEPRDFDVDNTKQFITRAAKAERKVKVIDDEFNPEETEMVADKNLGANPAVVEAAKKVMEKLDPVGKEDKDVNNDGKVDSTDGYLKKRRNAISSAMRAARQKEVQKKVDAESKKQWKKPPQAGTLSAMKKEEVESVMETKKGTVPKTPKEKKLAAHYGDPDVITHGDVVTARKKSKMQNEAAVTNNPGHGYHGQHSDDADQKYSKMHARVRTLTGTNSTMAKHYLDSTHGRHLAGNEGDSEYIKHDFLKFAKKYNADQFKEEVEQVDESHKVGDLVSYFHKGLGDHVYGEVQSVADDHITMKSAGKTWKVPLHLVHKANKNSVPKYRYEQVEQVDEGSKRMSAAVKLQRAFDREKVSSDASRKRGEEMLAQARAEYAKKQAAKTNEEVEQIDEIGNTEKGVKRLKDYVASDRSKVKIKDVLDAKRSADPDKAIEKLAKRQGYKSKALKKIRAFDAAKNPKPPEKEVPMGLKVYPPDMKYHGDSYEPTGDQTLDERNMENKAKKDNATRQIGAHAYIQGVKKDMQSPKIAGREVMKDPKLGSKKVADIYRKLPNPMKKEEVEQVDEGRRGRPPKDPVARAKFYAAVMDEPDQHIMMQLKKASDSEKPYHVTFKDGQKHPVEPGHAKKVIGKYMAMKPDEKKVYQKKIAKSHEHFMKAATEVEKPVAKKPLDQKQRMAAIARVAMKYKNKGRDKSFGDTAD